MEGLDNLMTANTIKWFWELKMEPLYEKALVSFLKENKEEYKSLIRSSEQSIATM